jgi:multisubunit Na+/H+ antiporter MnhG subunit
MIKAKAYRNKFLLLLILGISIYSGLAQLEIFSIKPEDRLIVSVVVVLLFLSGTFIMLPGFKRGPEVFVQRFFILTTVQMIGFFSIVAGFAYSKYPSAKTVIMHMLILVLFFLILQSVMLVKFSKDSN